jgi:hypothetical protein
MSSFDFTHTKLMTFSQSFVFWHCGIATNEYPKRATTTTYSTSV